ncbi:MAG TPA: carboxypeptidase-like regulatory domain-containing protein [Bacteroidales bacterium]|nr:carboxypeptidase-like regulatory domain-containing protein [Bacteroidales bacterium]HPS15852.1 carboxypeptidase-like regulatory domain-containing protein [Bacteroidales bacterium]
MKKYIYILFFVTLTIPEVQAQQNFYTIKGFIKDSITQTPLSSVSITCENNSEVSVSDNNGFFKINTDTIPCKLTISHLGYFEKQIFVSTLNSKVEIFLKEKINELPELSVTTAKPIPITKDEPLFITDYEFVQDKILALAYKNKVLSQARLYMLTLEGDTVFSVPVSKPEHLYKDCYENKYFISKNDAFQLAIDSMNIDFLYPYPTDEFKNIFSILTEARKEKMYMKKYSMNNQKLDYIEYDRDSKIYTDVITIENEKNTRMLYDRARMVCSADDPDVQARFEDLAFYKPVFAPLVNIHDTLYLFNFEDSWLGYFDDSNKIVKEIPIDFHHDKSWNREIFFDERSEKVYALFRKDGISTLKEICLETGQLINSIQIPNLPFVDNIKISNGKLYFLYTNHNTPEEPRMLYSMKI